MGPADKQPPFPEFEWTKLPKSHRYVTKFRLECNYLQAMEGDYDPSHARFLHSTLDNNASNPGTRAPTRSSQLLQQPPTDRMSPSREEPATARIGNRRTPRPNQRGGGLNAKLEDYEQAMLNVQTTQQAGRQAAGQRRRDLVDADLLHRRHRVARPLLQQHAHPDRQREPDVLPPALELRARSPTTDLAEYKHGGYTHPELIPGTWMPKANLQNDYLIDRVAQKNFSYTGIKTFPLQDIALIEDQWGPIAKREYEHLVSSDYMIIHVRQRLLKAAKELAEGHRAFKLITQARRHLRSRPRGRHAQAQPLPGRAGPGPGLRQPAQRDGEDLHLQLAHGLRVRLLGATENKVIGDIGQSWEFSPDGLTMTMKLRQGVKWHNKAPVNGRALDVDDVVFSWNRYAAKGAPTAASSTPPTPTRRCSRSRRPTPRHDRDQAQGAGVYAQLSLFAASRPAGNLIMLPKETDTGFDIRGDMIGTGPFFLDKYQPSVGFTFKRNPDYWDKDFAMVDQIDLPIVLEYAQRPGAAQGRQHPLRCGQSGGLRAEDILPTKKDVPELSIYRTTSTAPRRHMTFGWLPDGKSPFIDERVRQAYSMSWDRDAFIDAFYNVSKFEAEGLPVETRWNTCIPADLPGLVAGPAGQGLRPQREVLPAQHRRGEEAARGGGLRQRPRVTSNRITTNAITDLARSAEALEGMAQDAGFRIKINAIDYASEYIPKVRDANGQYEGVGFHTVTGTTPWRLHPISALRPSTGPRPEPPSRASAPAARTTRPATRRSTRSSRRRAWRRTSRSRRPTPTTSSACSASRSTV